MRAQVILFLIGTHFINSYSIINKSELSDSWISFLSNQRRYFNLKMKFRTRRKNSKKQQTVEKGEIVTEVMENKELNKITTTYKSDNQVLFKKLKENVVKSVEILNRFDVVKQEDISEGSQKKGQVKLLIRNISKMEKMVERYRYRFVPLSVLLTHDLTHSK